MRTHLVCTEKLNYWAEHWGAEIPCKEFAESSILSRSTKILPTELVGSLQRFPEEEENSVRLGELAPNREEEMENVYIQTEECYRKEQAFFASLNPFCPMGPDVEEITANELVGVLNSVAEPGPDRHYVVLEEK